MLIKSLYAVGFAAEGSLWDRIGDFVVWKYEFLMWCALGSALVGLCTGLLGVFLVLRRMSLVGDVLSHAMLPGLVGGFMLVERKGAIGVMYTGALVSGFLASLALGWVMKTKRTRPDAALGLVLTGFFGLGIVMLSRVQASDSGEQAGLTSYLFGQAVAISPVEVGVLGVLAASVIGVVVVMYRRLLVLSFDEPYGSSVGLPTGWLHYGLMGLTSLVIVASVQAVGVVLAVAMLVTPGAIGVILCRRLPWVLVVSGVVGVVSGYVGAMLSYLGEGWSSGPMMVLVASALFGVAVLVGKRRA